MSNLVRPQGTPYIGVGGKKRGIFFDPTIETGRMPGRNPSFESARSGVVPVPRPGTLAEIQSAMNSTPSLGGAETNHEFQSNFMVVNAVRDVGSKDTERSWLEGHLVMVQSKVYASAMQSDVSPFEDPAAADYLDTQDPFAEYVLDAEEEDNYGAVRVMPFAYFNHLMDGEKKLPKGVRYPNAEEVLHNLGITLGGLVNNQTGFTGPGYGNSNLPARDLVNMCIHGDSKMVICFDFPEETNGTIKGLKVYGILKRGDAEDMQRAGLPLHFVPDNGNAVAHPRRTGNQYPEKRFFLHVVGRRHAPEMDELEYVDDNGYLDRGKLFYFGEVNYIHQFPAGDSRSISNDVSRQRMAGLCTILFDPKEIEFCG